MLIKDLQCGVVFEYGHNSHDSLTISGDGRTLSYYNLQNGDGSQYGDYRFVMEDGEVPNESNTAEAMNGCCYAHIGYTDKDFDKGYEQGRAEAVEYLVLNGYIRYGFEAEYLLEQMGKIKEQKK